MRKLYSRRLTVDWFMMYRQKILGLFIDPYDIARYFLWSRNINNIFELNFSIFRSENFKIYLN